MKTQDTEIKKIAGADVVPVQLVKVADIVPDPKNRKNHDPAAITRLAASIKEDGLLQPITLRPNPDPLGEKYMLVAGERRWLAHRELKLVDVQARVIEGESELQATRKRAAENLHRENLNPIEEARQYQDLLDTGMKNQEVADFIGVDQSTISNRLRVMELPFAVQSYLLKGELSRAHGIGLCRFALYPTVCRMMAAMAIVEGTPSKDLEKGVPFADALVNQKVIGRIYGSDRDDAQKKHPAYVDGGHGWWYCMDRAVHDQLQREKSKRKREKIAKETAKAGGGKGEKAKTYPPINRNVHEQIRDTDADFLDLIPADKKVLVLEWRGASKPILVCSDKKLIGHLRDEAGERVKKQHAYDSSEALEAARAKLKGFDPAKSKGVVWAILLVELFCRLDSARVAKVAKAHGVPVTWVKQSWGSDKVKWDKTVDAWAKLTPAKLCAMVLDAIVVDEADVYAETTKDALCLAIQTLNGKPVKGFSAKSRELDDSKPKAGAKEPAAKPAAKATAKPIAKKKPGRVQLTAELKNQVVCAVQEGKSGAEIAKTFGISLPSVQNIKKEAGLVKARAEASRAAKEGTK